MGRDREPHQAEHEAVDRVVGRLSGTISSCVPGRLAFYEGEDPKTRCPLVRAGGR